MVHENTCHREDSLLSFMAPMLEVKVVASNDWTQLISRPMSSPLLFKTFATSELVQPES